MRLFPDRGVEATRPVAYCAGRQLCLPLLMMPAVMHTQVQSLRLQLAPTQLPSALKRLGYSVASAACFVIRASQAVKVISLAGSRQHQMRQALLMLPAVECLIEMQ